MTRRHALQWAGAGFAASIVPALAQDSASPEALAEEAFIWGFPLVISDTLFRSAQQKGENINRFVVQGALSTPAFNVPGPNVDTLYGSAWLNLIGGPKIIAVPDTEDRYYSIQLVDAYGNSFAYIGRRATGTKAGAYAIAPPGWGGDLPAGVTRIEATTPHVLALTRVLVTSEADLPKAVAIEAQFSIGSLSDYPNQLAPALVTVRPWKLPIPDVASRGHEYFLDLRSAVVANPPLPEEREAVGHFATLASSFSSQSEAAAVLNAAIPKGVAKIKGAWGQLSETSGGWSVNKKVTPIIHDPLLRAAINQYGPGTHIAEEALYWSPVPDLGAGLSGDNRYRLRFAKGQLPPVDAFWSLTLYGPDFLLVENEIKRYAITDRSEGLVTKADDSLEIAIQNEKPLEEGINWLPAPKGPFRLILRTYQPRPELLEGRYRLPPLKTV
ncbi:hypothetical protein FHS83_002102 [Rhizomicrobium palustre]|uniref:DUF1254 domain-containing protein n=1 Tax=Rhizomicrobium palustre TaxID=189966 RepID=A0A846MYS2_9PROT|nr:DUF1254 domain-containing protein [Rhizomicrobium palustre]NIK88784.1 hypothetical protein [Rhizomicrobium palustre]